jgi:uncharacterized protein
MTRVDLDSVLRTLHGELSAMFGADLHAVLLYGSQARGDARADSDIDVLIVMRVPFDYDEVVRRTLKLIADLSLEYDTVITPLFVTRDQFDADTSPFMLNIRREAIVA